ncbi:MAG: ABC-F family ATP-binding cassette domain-containing protein [Oscillospiraceae bacterium]|nr:ABC-F family ATP-binding cassette domain-containing protein [Oscillospiraceae bacterium]
MLELKDVTIRLKRDDRVLVDGLSLTLGRGDKAALIGEEGNGKSTLLQFLYDRRMVEDYCEVSGTVVRHGRAAWLPQRMPEALYHLSVAEFFDGTAYYLHTNLLSQLGLNVEKLFSEQTLGTLSGGEKVKLQLCRALLDEPDILLLDEPSNDLDIETLEWLERFIQRTKLPVLYISHDETLIERTANVIVHAEQLIRKTRCRVTVAKCGYRDYLDARRRKFESQDRIAQKQRDDYDAQMARWRQIHDRVEHEQRVISRGDPGGGRLLKKKMHTVLSTGRRLERQREQFQEFSEEEKAILTRFDPEVRVPAGKVVLDYSLDRLTVDGRTLAEGLRLCVAGPTIVGITGRNGAGKSTLLRLLWEKLRERRDISAAWMPQDYGEVLDESKTPIEFFEAQHDKEALTLARTRLGSMRFTHEEMTGPIRALSGGQRAKILFLDMVLKRANVLLLDEPTRNFSPLSAPVVRAALRDFGGAIISVSHDRRYLAEVCDVVYELDGDGLRLISE